MSHLNSSTRRRKPAALAAFISVLLLGCLGLAACGSSSGSSSGTNASASTATTATTSTSTTPSGAAGAGGPNSGRFAAIRACMQKNGITLPQRTPGQRRPPGAAGGFLGGGAGGPQLPKGVTRAQYEAALKKCGGGNFAGGPGAGPRGARVKNPAFQTALAKFASCLREHGVNVPAPNTSGNGPVFDTKGIDTSSAQFRAAEAKCRAVLIAAFRSRGTGAGTGGSATPPAGGEAPPAK